MPRPGSSRELTALRVMTSPMYMNHNRGLELVAAEGTKVADDRLFRGTKVDLD